MKYPPDLREKITEIVEKLYDIGKVTNVHEIFGGFSNRSFGIDVVKKGVPASYFVRQYKRGIAVEEIGFEHRLINHAIENGFREGDAVVKNCRGNTFVRPPDSNRLFAVYEYLAGQDRYTWDRPGLTDTEFESAGRLLAVFHNAVRAFDPGAFRRHEPPILQLWPQLPEKLKQLARRPESGKLFTFFRRHLDVILHTMVKTELTPAAAEGMPVIAAHCDYHPGNLKWDNEAAVGLFDFDWAKMDLRLFDVCMALVYFCSSWDGDRDGEMRLDKMALFLASYQRILVQRNGLDPIDEDECALVPTMLAVGNFYLLHWGLNLFAANKAADNDEYLTYLQHSVRLMRWIDGHREIVAETAAAALMVRSLSIS